MNYFLKLICYETCITVFINSKIWVQEDSIIFIKQLIFRKYNYMYVAAWKRVCNVCAHKPINRIFLNWIDAFSFLQKLLQNLKIAYSVIL